MMTKEPGMALVDHSDRPPPRRAPLPTKEQIEAITDVEELSVMEADVERRAEKITVDLEMEVGDEDWDARARGALTAHRICLRAIRRRAQQLKRAAGKNDAPKPPPMTEEMAGRVAAALMVEKATLIRETSLHMHFYRAARAALAPEVFEQIEATAEERLTRAVERIASVDRAKIPWLKR